MLSSNKSMKEFFRKINFRLGVIYRGRSGFEQGGRSSMISDKIKRLKKGGGGGLDKIKKILGRPGGLFRKFVKNL